MGPHTLGTVAALVMGAWLADRFLLWCEVRGWIYYRRTKRRPGLGTSPLANLLSVYHPPQRHVLERMIEQDNDRDGEEQDGGRPDPE